MVGRPTAPSAPSRTAPTREPSGLEPTAWSALARRPAAAARGNGRLPWATASPSPPISLAGRLPTMPRLTTAVRAGWRASTSRGDADCQVRTPTRSSRGRYWVAAARIGAAAPCQASVDGSRATRRDGNRPADSIALSEGEIAAADLRRPAAARPRQSSSERAGISAPQVSSPWLRPGRYEATGRHARRSTCSGAETSAGCSLSAASDRPRPAPGACRSSCP